MEMWIIWALLSALTAGLYNFGLKVLAERNYNSYLSTFYDYFLCAFISGVYLIYYFSHHQITINDFLITSLLASVNVIFFSLSIFTRVESMRNIDTVIFYPLYKTFGPIFVTFISIFYFKEVLTMKEFIGIVCGISIPLMLLTKSENRIQKNLLLGVMLVIVTSILTAISTFGIKELMIQNLSIELFIFMSFIIGMGVTLLSHKLHIRKTKRVYQTKGLFLFSMGLGLIHLLSFVVFVLAMSGNMAIVFTINSFSILVPIILSIIIYGEHFNFKKGVVIALSIVSILLFI